MVIVGKTAGELGEGARQIRRLLTAEFVEQDLEPGEMLLGELPDVGFLAAGAFRCASIGAAELEIKRFHGVERRQALKSAPLKDRRFQRQLRRKSDLDFVRSGRRSALVVDQPRPARAQEVDSVSPRAELEPRAALERNGDCAVLLDPDARDIGAGFAFESKKEVEARFDTGPLQ